MHHGTYAQRNTTTKDTPCILWSVYVSERFQISQHATVISFLGPKIL